MAKAKKKMTLDDLAGMTQKGFTELHEEIASVKHDTIFLKADNLLIRNDLAEVKQDVKEMQANSGELFKKLDDFISTMKKNEQEIVFFGAQMRRLEERVSKLEAKKK